MPEALVYPGAKWTPLGAQTQRRMVAHDIACLHTMVGYLLSTDRYFRIYNGEGFRGTESHWGMGGKWGPDLGGGLDGEVYQWQDMAFSADANLEGWGRVLSMETADNGGPQVADIPPWTPAQVEGLARWLAWVCSKAAHAECPSSWRCHQEGIPLELIPDTKPGRRGVGYHRQGCDPYRVSGGELWSSSFGKACPTDQRIVQIPAIIRRAREITTGAERDWFDMADKDDLRDVVKEEVAEALRGLPGKVAKELWHNFFNPRLEQSYGRIVSDTNIVVDEIRDLVKKLPAQIWHNTFNPRTRKSYGREVSDSSIKVGASRVVDTSEAATKAESGQSDKV